VNLKIVLRIIVNIPLGIDVYLWKGIDCVLPFHNLMTISTQETYDNIFFCSIDINNCFSFIINILNAF